MYEGSQKAIYVRIHYRRRLHGVLVHGPRKRDHLAATQLDFRREWTLINEIALEVVDENYVIARGSGHHGAFLPGDVVRQ